VKLTNPRVRHLAFGLGLVLLSNLLVLGLLLKGSLLTLAQFSDDNLMQQAAGRLNLGSIAIAAVDDASLRQYGRFESWDRRHYADLVRRLKQAGAQALALDVDFSAPNPGDQDLAQAIDQAMRPRDGSAPMPVILGIAGSGEGVRTAGKGLEYPGFSSVSPALLAAKPILAGVNLDLDGVTVRNLPLLSVSGQQQILPLPLIAASAFAARLPGFTNALEFQDDPYRLHFGPYFVPIDQYFRMPIYFFSKPNGYAPNAISLASIADGQIDPAVLRGRLVLAGVFGAVGEAQDFPVPTSAGGGQAKMDRVEIWANAAQSLIEGKFITPQPWPSTLGFMLLLSLAAATFFFRFGALGWLATLGIGVLYSIVRYMVAVSALVQPAVIGHQQITELPNLAYPNVALLLSSAALFMYLFVREQRQRSAVYSTFGRYVTPAVAQQLASQQADGTLNLGGTRRIATVLFGNLYLAEEDAEGDTLGLLNSYWDGIVRKVNENHGTVNKFIGDHIMVLFNVPVDLENHAEAACRGAYEALEWIKQTRDSLPHSATFGVGINSGPLVAGNMGSKKRMEYTVLGDTVNTSSRLSGVAKDDEIIISKATADLLDGSGAKLEDRGEVRVKGKAEPVRIFALMGFGDPGPVQVSVPIAAAAVG